MDWIKTTNKFPGGKQINQQYGVSDDNRGSVQADVSISGATRGILSEQILQEYLVYLREEMNYRLFFETTEESNANIFLPLEQVLWVESIAVENYNMP